MKKRKQISQSVLPQSWYPESFTFFSDSCHAWLEVPLQLVKELRLQRSISDYSYVSNDHLKIYLEEDRDCVLFLNTYQVYAGIPPEEVFRRCNNIRQHDLFIRYLERFKPTSNPDQIIFEHDDYRISIGDITVICNGDEFKTLREVCNQFAKLDLEEVINFENEETARTITFKQLNMPESNASDLCISVWGEYGYMSNKIADMHAQQAFGVYFSVLIFLDGCQEYFRTDRQDHNESGFITRGMGLTVKN